MYKLEILENAKEDMDNIIYYISHDLKNKVAASNLAKDFIKEINNLSQFPYGGTEYIPIKPLKNKYRKSKVKNYLIFYIVNEKNKTVTIARVLYEKRNIIKVIY